MYDLNDDDEDERAKVRWEVGDPGPGFWAWAVLVLWAIGLIVAFLALLVAAFLTATDAGAHEAQPTAAKPNGWSYSALCCHNRDCSQVPADWITEGPDGISIVSTGELLTYSDARIKESPDGEVHWCRNPDDPNPRTICLYLPPKGM